MDDDAFWFGLLLVLPTLLVVVLLGLALAAGIVWLGRRRRGAAVSVRDGALSDEASPSEPD